MQDSGRGSAAGGVPSWVGDRQRGSRGDFMSPLAVTADCGVGDITHSAHRHADTPISLSQCGHHASTRLLTAARYEAISAGCEWAGLGVARGRG